MKQSVIRASVIALFILMLLFPEAVFAGASRGLLLWFQTVLPTLLPFMILSSLLIQTRAIDWLVRLTAPVLCRFFRVTAYGSFVILAGFLCGYPMGGKVTSDLLDSGDISFGEAGYLLSFCNNASPIFIISYVVLQNLHNRAFIFPALTILTASPVLSSFLFRRFYITPGQQAQYNGRGTSVHVKKETSAAASPVRHGSLMDTCIMNAFEALTKVGGYIMLFSVLLSLAGLLPVSGIWFHDILLPSLEMTNGIAVICGSHLSENLTFLLCMICTSFGGFCAAAQTKCMIAGSGLSVFPYIIEKLVTAFVTSLLSCIYLLFV